MKRHAFMDSLQRVYGDLMIQSLPRSGRPKLSCTCDTLSVLGHASAVIAVYILFQRITKYILYRFKVTGSLVTQRIASVGVLYYNLCVRLSLEMFCFEPGVGLIKM